MFNLKSKYYVVFVLKVLFMFITMLPVAILALPYLYLNGEIDVFIDFFKDLKVLKYSTYKRKYYK